MATPTQDSIRTSNSTLVRFKAIRTSIFGCLLLLLVGCFAGNEQIHYELASTTLPMRPAWEYVAKSRLWSPAVIYDDAIALVYDGAVVHAIDIETGSVQWEWENPRPDKAGSVEFGNSFKLSDKGVLFVPGERGQLYALEANTGRELWEFSAYEYFNRAFPTQINVTYLDMDRDHLFVEFLNADDRRFYVVALDPDDGRGLWQAEGNIVILVVTDDALIGASGYDLLSLDKDTGAVIKRQIRTPPIAPAETYLGTVAIIIDEEDKIVASSLLDNRRVWEFDPGCRTIKDIVARGEDQERRTVYVATGCGTLYKLDGGTGEPLWTYQDSVSPLNVAANGEHVFVLRSDIALLQLNALDGEVIGIQTMTPPYPYLSGGFPSALAVSVSHLLMLLGRQLFGYELEAQ